MLYTFPQQSYFYRYIFFLSLLGLIFKSNYPNEKNPGLPETVPDGIQFHFCTFLTENYFFIFIIISKYFLFKLRYHWLMVFKTFVNNNWQKYLNSVGEIYLLTKFRFISFILSTFTLQNITFVLFLFVVATGLEVVISCLNARESLGHFLHVSPGGP